MKPKYLSTGKMAKYLGYSRDKLKDLKDAGILKKDIHYTIPIGCKHPRWNVEKMEEWAAGKVKISDTAKAVLDNVTSF